MWTLKFRAIEKWNIYNERCLKFGVKIYFYSHNYYEEKGNLFFVGSGILEGDDKMKRKFFLDLQKDKKVVHFENSGDFFMCTYSEPKSSERVRKVSVAYNPRLIFPSPVIINEEGWEEWIVASNERKVLGDFLEVVESCGVEYEFFYLKKKKLCNMMIYSMVPGLTDKQRVAISLAVSEGYYESPRKVTLEKLAKKIGKSVSTFQFHLARAEAKLIPFVVKGKKLG